MFAIPTRIVLSVLVLKTLIINLKCSLTANSGRYDQRYATQLQTLYTYFLHCTNRAHKQLPFCRNSGIRRNCILVVARVILYDCVTLVVDISGMDFEATKHEVVNYSLYIHSENKVAQEPPSRRHPAAHVELQIVPMFPQSLTIRVVGSILNDTRRRYEKFIVLGQ